MTARKAPTLGDLRDDPGNPRKDRGGDSLERFAKAMATFGDLSGIVYNRRLGLLVGGHRRKGRLPLGSKIVRTEEFKEPTEIGTVAVGYVLAPDGERWSYREVEWDEPTHKAANVAANNPSIQGEFEFSALADVVAELEGIGLGFTTGYDSGELEKILAWTPTPDPGARYSGGAAEERSVRCPECGYEWDPKA